MVPEGIAVIGPKADLGFRLYRIPSPDPMAQERRGEPASRHPPKDYERNRHGHAPTTGKRSNTATQPRDVCRPCPHRQRA